MRTTRITASPKPIRSKQSIAADLNQLHRLAFNNSLQPNIISIVSDGKIIDANLAACRLLGYSKKELLSKNRNDIFNLSESSYVKMVRIRAADGHVNADVNLKMKNGKLLSCEITSVIFVGNHQIEKSITTIADKSQIILKQNNIDAKKQQIVADNIVRAKSKQKAIDVKNGKIVADNIVRAKSKQKAIDVKKEKIVADNIILAKSKQKDIDIKKEGIVANNIIIAKEKADSLLVENTEWFQSMAITSYDVMWNWDLESGDIYVGDSVEEIFGYKIPNNIVSFSDFLNCLLPKQKSIVEKSLMKSIASDNENWSDSFQFRCSDGSVAITISRANIVRDDDGKAKRFIGATHDITKLRELEKKLGEQTSIKRENSEIFRLAAKLSYDGIWDWNLLTNEFFLGQGFEELFGYDLKNNTGNKADWSKHLHPDDKAAVEKGLADALASSVSHWEHAYRFIKADGSIANVFGRATIIREPGGKARRMIGVVHDISKQRVLEERLEQEIMLKETQIAEATDEAKATERSDIGRELHDNVNQLLGASRLYLDMAKLGGKNSEMYLGRSSDYTITAIEEIRKLTKGLTTDIIKDLGLCEAISNAARDMMEVNPCKITCELKSFIEDSVDDKFKVNIFRIVQEQLNNILKHAKATIVTIRLLQNKKSTILSISDNGIGFDTDKKRKGIGIENIKARATTYNGIADIISKPGQSCILNVTFPISKMLITMVNTVSH